MLDVRQTIMEAGGLSANAEAANAMQLGDEAQAEVFKREIELAAPIAASINQSAAVILSPVDPPQSLPDTGTQGDPLSSAATSSLLVSAPCDSGAADSSTEADRRESLLITKEERKNVIQEKLAAKEKRDEEASADQQASSQ